MKKAEAEQMIRHLCGEWANEKGLPHQSQRKAYFYASYSEFKNWCIAKGYGNYFEFRSKLGANYDANLWFDNEFNQAGLR